MHFAKPIAVCGQVHIKTPIDRTDRGYECAAWWQTTRTDTGVYDIGLMQGNGSSTDKSYHLVASVPATVTDAYFGSLFGGVPIGKYDKSRDVGKRVNEWISVSALHGIETYNWSFTEGTQWIFKPEFWPMISEYYTQLLHESMKGARISYNNHMGLPNNPGDYDGWGFNMIGYFSERVSEAVRSLEKIERQTGYLKNPSCDNTKVGPSLRRLFIADAQFNGWQYKKFSWEDVPTEEKTC